MAAVLEEEAQLPETEKLVAPETGEEGLVVPGRAVAFYDLIYIDTGVGTGFSQHTPYI